MPKNYNKNKYILFSILFALLTLFATYYAKYTFNSLNLNEFDFYNVGNILNFSVTIILVFGLLAHIFIDHGISIWYFRFITFFLSVSFSSILLLIILHFIGFTYPKDFIFLYTFKKVFVGILFISSGVFQIFVSVLLWVSLFSSSRVVPIKAMLLTALSIALAVCITFYIGTTYSPESEIELVSLQKTKIGVVLGAAVWQKNQPSPLFKARIEKASELYRNRVLQKIQLTGGNAPGELSEAKAANLYIESLGVDGKDILIEEKTSTTSEQIFFIKRNLTPNYKNTPIVIISDHFHIKRVMEMCKFYGVNAIGVTSDYSLNWEKLVYYRVRDSIGLLLFWFFAI